MILRHVFSLYGPSPEPSVFYNGTTGYSIPEGSNLQENVIFMFSSLCFSFYIAEPEICYYDDTF